MSTQYQLFLESWSDAVIATDYDAIMDCYAENAVLVPTLSSEKRQTRASRLDYFQGFAVKVKGAHWYWEDAAVQRLSDTLILSGEYDFILLDESISKARFSFVLEEEDDSYKILHHHSSLLPDLLS